MNNVIFYVFLGLAVVISLNALLSSKASDMAQDKGYEKRTWFHMCFWLGPISYIIIAAMPDRIMQSKLDHTNMLLDSLLKEQYATSETREKSQQTDISRYMPEL